MWTERLTWGRRLFGDRGVEGEKEYSGRKDENLKCTSKKYICILWTLQDTEVAFI